MRQDPFESKYEFFINGREKAGIEKLKNEKHSLIIHKQLIIFMKIQKIIYNKKEESVNSV